VPPTEVDQVLPKLAEADGVLLFHLCGHGGDAPLAAMTRIVEQGLPTVVFSQPFSGHGWMFFPAWRKQGKKVVLLPSSDWGELDKAAMLLRVKPHMARTRILVVRGPLGTDAACSAEKVKAKLGVEMIPVSVEETLKAHAAVSLKDAEAEAQQYWISKARKIVEPTKDEIISSARFYLATKRLMQEKGARAVTSSNCMGEPAKGCLTYSKLNDLGLVGACEGDMDSTLTMLLFQYAFGVPGFITDPVFDTANNALIHFHCTCATQMAGPGSKRLPFTIRTQTDSDRGVALAVEMPIGQSVTCAKFVNLDTMVASTGAIFKVTTDDLGCRTQFWTHVKDARSMFQNWGAGVINGGIMTMLHRVVFFGDHLQSLQDLGSLMDYKLVEEA
jgi:L-arabinose isomerase